MLYLSHLKKNRKTWQKHVIAIELFLHICTISFVQDSRACCADHSHLGVMSVPISTADITYCIRYDS